MTRPIGKYFVVLYNGPLCFPRSQPNGQQAMQRSAICFSPKYTRTNTTHTHEYSTLESRKLNKLICMAGMQAGSHIDTRTDGEAVKGRLGRQTSRADGRTAGQLDGKTDGQADGWTDSWTDN